MATAIRQECSGNYFHLIIMTRSWRFGRNGRSYFVCPRHHVYCSRLPYHRRTLNNNPRRFARYAPLNIRHFRRRRGAPSFRNVSRDSIPIPGVDQPLNWREIRFRVNRDYYRALFNASQTTGCTVISLLGSLFVYCENLSKDLNCFIFRRI